MAEISCRSIREKSKQRRSEIKKTQKELRQNQRKEGLIPLCNFTVSNSEALRPKSEHSAIFFVEVNIRYEEERQASMDLITKQRMLFRCLLPKVLKELQRLSDPRNPKKIKHKLTVLIVYGILSLYIDEK